MGQADAVVAVAAGRCGAAYTRSVFLAEGAGCLFFAEPNGAGPGVIAVPGLRKVGVVGDADAAKPLLRLAAGAGGTRQETASSSF